MLDWDIDKFPLMKVAAPTPGQIAAEKWLREHPDEPMREIRPGDLDRLTQQHQDDPNDRFFGVPTGGGGLYGSGGGMRYGPEGYNQPDRRYPSSPGDPGYQEPPSSSSYYHMPGITHPHDLDEDEEYEQEPVNYHVVTGPRGSTNPDEWTEHPNTMFEHPDAEMDPDAAHDTFMEDHPQYDTERHPENTHEVIHVHPAEHHDIWRNQLRDEDQVFGDVASHGFEREAPDMPGHMAYRHVDPHGGIHRLWHNETHFVNGPDGDHGPGWRTSYYDPELRSNQQLPWSFHDDNVYGGNSLNDALERVERNKAHSDISHAGVGLKPVENNYGRHYVSKRPSDNSTQQLLYNARSVDGSPNWMLAHYHPEDSTQHTVTYHGGDLSGALEQARSNLARE